VAHDIRAPLRAISGMAQILLAETGPRLDDDSRQLLERITSAASRLQTLTSDLLAYSSIARADLPLTRLALRPVIVQSVEALNADIAARQATVKVEDDFPEVQGNLSLLSQVFTNLVGNAIKYVPPERAPIVRVRCERGDSKVRLWVEDNGPGVPEEFQQTIFEPFQRLPDSSRVPGTGIGLAIVERAVKRMNGSVGVESREGEGSRFWVELPE
jgi:signal transduction histidine kinase